MKFRQPIVQAGLTRREATETRDSYLKRNPGAQVSIERQPDNPQFFTLIAHLPLLPSSAIRKECDGWYRGWKN